MSAFKSDSDPWGFQAAGLNRRSFLTLLAAGLSAQFLGACSNQNAALTVRALSGAIPPQILGEFQKFLKQSTGDLPVNFSAETQLQTLFSLLQTWRQEQQSVTIPDLVTLGDYWLEKAIQQKLIQPIATDKLKGWAQLPPAWKTLVTRNAAGQLDAKGQVWAAPYRWGTTVIAYRKDIFRDRKLAPPTDWSDLWRPDLRGQISLPDQAREVIGLTLKRLGKSYNTQNLETVAALKQELRTLHAQVKLYSSDAYQQPLLLDDTWVAVGWSTDILTLMQRNPQIAAVVPQSGTALWAELWVRPVQARAAEPIVHDWISFAWKPTIATQLSLLSDATAPGLLGADPQKQDPELQQNPVLLPDAPRLRASEFLQPLPPAAIDQYRALWQQMRQGR
jgi:putative spermidine/putrescine transport system substrate-binding protein